MNERQKLRVFDASGVDLTQQAFDFARDSFSVGSINTTDPFTVGRYKPFNILYIEVDQDHPSAVDQRLVLKYWNGSAWTTLDLLTEDTKGLQQSGFVKWAQPVDDTRESLWVESSYSPAVGDDVTGFFLQVLTSSAGLTSGTLLKGIGIVFANDQDLKTADYSILKLRPKDENDVQVQSHILSHVEAREAILERLNRDGKLKTQATDGSIVNLDEWDLSNVDQIRTCAKYCALAKIYLESSDTKDDIYWAKYEKYDALYNKAYDLYLLSLDLDDDGIESVAEQERANSGGTFHRG